MARHQGNLSHITLPYELSRSAIEKMIKCEACFWLEKVQGIKLRACPVLTSIQIRHSAEEGL